MRALRRLAFPVRLALVRLRARAGASTVAGLGIAAAAATLAAVLGASLVARDGSLQRAVGEIPEAQRAIRAVWFGVPSRTQAGYDALDARARDALGGLPTGIVLFRQGTIAGSFLGLGAVDGLAPWVRLVSGRLPRPCRPERCEVVRLGGEGRVPRTKGLQLAVVGEARLRSETLFGSFLAPEENALARAALSPLVRQAELYHQPPPPPFVLAEGVGGLVASPELAAVFRSYAWVSALAATPWEVEPLARRLAETRASLQTESGAFDLAAPVEELRAAEAAGQRAGTRLLLVGGQAAALLLAFAALAAAGRRRDLELWRRRLTWLGARRWQLGALGAGEALVVAVGGVACGWLIGAVVTAAIARAAGSPPLAVVTRSALSGGGLLAAAALALAAALVLVAARRDRRGRGIGTLDAAALAAVAALAIGLARGAVDPGEEGTAAFLLLLPALATFAAAVGLGRALGPAAALVIRAVPARRISLRLALLSLARGAGPAAAAAAFLLVSLGLAVFAESYRATLARGQADQAAFAVPLDFRVREDLSRLIPVREAAPLARFAALGRAESVLRLPGGVSRPGGASGITVLGLDPSVLPRLRGWRAEFSAFRPHELAELIRPPRAATPTGPPVPAGRLTLETSGMHVRIRATVLHRDREATVVDLPGSLARGGVLLGLTIRPVTRTVERGADSGRALRGELELGPIRAGGVAVGYRGWIGSGGVEVEDAGARARLALTLSDTEIARFRPRQPTDGRPIPVLASPAVADSADEDGVVPLQVGGEALVARVTAVSRRLPGVTGDFVVADRGSLETALAAARPGAAQPDEVWLEAAPGREPAVAEALRRDPFDVLDVRSRTEVEETLRADPLARVALATLVVAALIALALALAGLVLVVLADLRDERGEFFDLEAQGAEPALLRRQVRLRVAMVATIGLAGGLAVGAVLSAMVVDLVALTANAGIPEPPLRLGASWPVLALALAGYAAAVAAVVGWTTRRAFPS